MPAPPAYLDECVDHNLVEALRQRGFDVLAAGDVGNLRLDDNAQLAYATQQQRMLITHNGRDFRLMHTICLELGQPHGGMIILPERPPLDRLAIRAAMMLIWLEPTASGGSPFGFFVWGQLQRLLEQGYRPPGFSESDVRLAVGW